MIRLGITGTDTGVGKTIVAAAIIAALRERGLRVAPMKPVESGTDVRFESGADVRSPHATSDAELLLEAAGGGYPLALVRPVLLAEPLAPLVAAQRANALIAVRLLDDAFHTLASGAGAIVVEGAGGLLVPITEQESFATLFARWALELVVVAANRLGAINHTLLTVHAARSHGIAIRGVVLNSVSDAAPDLAARTNPAALQQLLGAVPVVTFPHIASATGDAAAMRRARSSLDRILA